MDDLEVLLSNIRYYIKEKELSIIHLSKIAVVNSASLHRILNKSVSPTVAILSKLAKGLGIPLYRLFLPRGNGHPANYADYIRLPRSNSRLEITSRIYSNTDRDQLVRVEARNESGSKTTIEYDQFDSCIFEM
jgi:transcriptional regulator with XRE-family HTH domain